METASAAEARALLSALGAAAQELFDREEAVGKELIEQKERIAALEEDRRGVEEELTKAREEKNSLANIISGYELRLQSREKKAQDAQEKHRGLQMDQNNLQSRIRMLTEMEKLYEGYSKAVKMVMGEAERGQLKGVLGPVAGLLRVPGEYTVAIETALGGAMQNIVVEREEDGKAVIQYLKRRDGGPGHHPAPQLHPPRLSQGGAGAVPGARLCGNRGPAHLLRPQVPKRLFQPAGPGGRYGESGRRHRRRPEVWL